MPRLATISLIAALALVSFELHAQELTDKEESAAIYKATELLEIFGHLSNFSPEMSDGERSQFVSLFTLNARIPLDYIKGSQNELVSPESYRTEYEYRGVEEPLNIRTRVLEKEASARRLLADDDIEVVLLMERSHSHLLDDGQYKALDAAKVVVWKTVVLISKSGSAKISRVNLLNSVDFSRLSLDIAFHNALTQAVLVSNPESSITGLDGMEVNASNIDLGVSYRFPLFYNALSEKPVKLYGILGLGASMASFSSPGVSLSGDIVDYLEFDDVVQLVNAGVLNDIGQRPDDFILFMSGEFPEEKFNTTSGYLDFGLGYQVFERTAIEFGMSYRTASEGSLEIEQSEVLYAEFSEGYFEGNTIVIEPNQVTYNGTVVPFQDDNDNYLFRRQDVGVERTVDFQSNISVETRLIQQFQLGNTYFGAEFLMRAPLGSILSTSEAATASLYENAVQGVPRVKSLVEEYKPIYLGIGLRFQF